MSCLDFVFPDDLKAAKELFELNKRPSAEPFHFKLKRADGTPVWADIQGSVMRTANGEVYAVSATVTKAKEGIST